MLGVTGFSFYVWSLKTCVMQQSEQPSNEDFIAFLFSSVQNIVNSYQHRHKSTNPHSVDYTAIKSRDSMVYL